MKKTLVLLLILLLILQVSALAAPDTNLDGLSLAQLEALRQEADARIRLMRVPDAEGFLAAGDGEAFARNPGMHLNEKVRLDGEILRVDQDADGFRYFISLDGNPGRIFLVRYALEAGQRLLLAGDAVTVFGTFEGLAPFDGAGLMESGAPTLSASLVIPKQPETKPLAADPYAGTREDPAPLGVRAVYEGSYWSGYAAFEVEMVSSLRGAAAQSLAQEMSKYNITPLRDQEYLLVWLRVKALSAPEGIAEIGDGDFSFVSASGSVYMPHYLLNSTQTLRSLVAGGEQTALIACIIDKGDQPLILFQPASENPLWFDPGRRQAQDLSGQFITALQLNDAGPQVARMKALLAEMGFLGKLDGTDRYTSAVRSALTEYQRAMGLKATGTADEETLRLLLSGVYPPGLER